MNYGLYPTDSVTSDSHVNNGVHEAMSQLAKLYSTTGSDYFKEQLDNLKAYMKSLPEEKCVAWGINKKQFEIEPTPIPSEPLYGLLSFFPESKGKEYTVRIFKDLEQARRTEAAAIVQSRKVESDQQVYHPTLYRVKFEPIESVASC